MQSFFLLSILMLLTCGMEEAQIINPFGYLVASKVVDENRKPLDYWLDYLATNEPAAENEFYVLFSDGLLVKKGRSKFASSQYLKGEKYIPFRKVYARLGV